MIDEARFWAKVDKSGDCWIWTAAKTGRGYGNFALHGGNIAAHRYSWEITNGPIPDGRGVLHECDTLACVRPDHLFLGTQRQNVADMIGKGRARYPGATNPQSGDAHWTHRTPEKMNPARGDRNGWRTKPNAMRLPPRRGK